jgi:hypothetical protein
MHGCGSSQSSKVASLREIISISKLWHTCRPRPELCLIGSAHAGGLKRHNPQGQHGQRTAGHNEVDSNRLRVEMRHGPIIAVDHAGGEARQ